MANTLKAKQLYDNPYEAAYNLSKGNPWFNQEDWDSMAKKGRLDDYITIMDQTDKLPNINQFNKDYRPDLLDTNRRFTAMANELYGDKENKKPRTEVQFDPAQNKEVEVALGDMSDYDYTKYLITQYKDWQLDKIRVEEEQMRKDAMNFWEKSGAYLLGIGGEMAAGSMDFVDDIGTLLQGINDGLDAMGKGENFGDAFRNAYTNPDWEIFNNLGWAEDIREWERKYSGIRSVDGEYTSMGKIFGGVSYSLGKALPSMGLNLIGAGLGKAGVEVGTGIGKASTLLYFTGLGSGTFKEMINDPRMTSVPTWQLLSSATIKTSFEYLIMKGMSNAFGPSQLDKLVFGQTATKAAGKATFGTAMKRVGMDFLQEGIEELGQNFSSYLWDQAYGLVFNEQFGQMSDWNMQTAFDAFILGGLSTIGTNALSIITTKKVNLGDKKLGKHASWVFKGDLSSMSAEFHKVINNKKLSTDQRLQAVGQMYASFRTISSVYGEIGEQRFKAATDLLNSMKALDAKQYLTTEQVQDSAKTLYNLVSDMQQTYGEKVIKDLILAGITKELDVINKGDDPGSINLPEPVKEKALKAVKAIFDADKGTERIILTEDGTTVVSADGALFVPIKYALNDDGTMILNTVAEQDLVKNVIAEPSLKIVLNNVKGVFESVTGRTNVDMSEIVYNLFFNDNFYKVTLQVANQDMLKVLSALEGIANKATGKSVKDTIYRKKIKDSMKAFKIALVNYLVFQQNANYLHLPMLNAEQKAFIAKQRWSRDLANRIIKGDKLTTEDMNHIQNRVNSMPATKDIKQQILDGIKDTRQGARRTALTILEKYYRDVYNSPYNGVTYLTNDSVPNVMFNEYIKSMGLTVDTLLQPIPQGELYNHIVEGYGEVTGETLLKYYQDQFSSYTNGKYSFTYHNGKVFIKEETVNNKPGYNNFKANRSGILSDANMDQRTIINVKQDTSGLLNNVIGNQVTPIQKSYMTIRDAIFNPTMLTKKMQADITNQYGELTPMNTFLYLRQYYLEKYNTVSIAMLSDGGFAFVDVKPMLGMLTKTEVNTSMINDDSTAKDFIKAEFLHGRLSDVKITLGDDGTYYDVQSNVISIDRSAAQNPSYVRFALLHEFQHAIQTENKLNGGINEDWLSLSGMNKTQKNNLIADVKKHMPDLFKGVKANDLASNLKIVSQFVYDTSGESQAYGVDANNKLVDFYPTLVRLERNKTTIVLPWGARYTFDGDVSVEQSLNVSDVEVLPVEEYQEFNDARTRAFKLWRTDPVKASEYRTKLNNINRELNTMPEIENWTRLGYGTIDYGDISDEDIEQMDFDDNGNYYHNGMLVVNGPGNNNTDEADAYNKFSGEKHTKEKRKNEIKLKQQLLDKITPSVRNKMLEGLRLLLTPDVEMNKFLEMDIPFTRLQVIKDVSNDPFVSIALDATGDLTAIANMFSKVPERYLYVGTIKPKELLGAIPSHEKEGLIKPEQLKNARLYSADYETDIVLNDTKLNNIQRMSMAKLDGDINQVTVDEYFDAEFSKLNFKDLHDKVLEDFNNENDKAKNMLDNSWDTFTKLQEDYYNDMPKDYKNAIEDYIDPNTYTSNIKTDNINLKNSLLKYVNNDAKQTTLKYLYKTIAEGYLSYEEFLKLDIPYYRIQSFKIANDKSELYSVFIGHKAAKDKLDIATELTKIADLMLKDPLDFYVKVGSVKPTDVLLLGDFSIGEALISKNTLKKTSKMAHFIFNMELQKQLYPERFSNQQMSMAKAKQPPKQPGEFKYKTRVLVGTNKDGTPKYKYTYDKKTYVSNKKAAGTNLQYFIQKNRPIQLDPAVQDFVVKVDPNQIDPEIWSMIGGDRKGTLTKQLVYNYLRKASKVDNYTFKLINDHFFQNDAIKTFDQLEYLLNSDISQYYALRAILKSIGAEDRLLEQISHQQFKRIINELSNMPKLQEKFEAIVTRFDYYKNATLDIDYENLRIPFMKYFDGSIDSAGNVAVIGRMLAINGWNIPGQIRKGTSLNQGIDGTDMDYNDVVSDENTQNALESIISGKDRTQKINELLNDVLFPKLLEEFEKSTKVPTREDRLAVMDKAAQIREDVEALSDADLDEYYAREILGETIREVKPLTRKDKTVLRPERNISKNVRTLASRIKNFLNNNIILKNDAKRVIEAHSDIFNDDLSLKPSVLANANREEMLAVEDMLRTINRDLRSGLYHNKKMADLKKSLKLAQKRLEREKLKNYKNKTKKIVVEKIINLGNDQFTIDTTADMPNVLKTILSVSFDKLAPTDVKFFTQEGEHHMQMNLKNFLDANAVQLSGLIQGDVDAIVDFYMNSLPRGDTTSADYVKYNAFKIYILAYLLDTSGKGEWTLSPNQVATIETHLKAIAQSAGTDLAVWRSVLKKVDPDRVIINSLARMTGIEFAQADIEQVSSAIKTGDIAKIKAAMDNLYTSGLKLYKGSKKSYWTKAWRLQRLFMLSSPGTALRNISSNVIVASGNAAGSVIGNILTKIAAKFRKKQYGDQYKIVGTKVSTDVQSYIKTNILDTGLLNLVADGLNKYDIRKADKQTTTDIVTDLVVNSVASKIFNNNQFDTKTMQTISNLIFKMLNDDPFINKATIKYFGKMLQEDGFDVSKGLNEQALVTLAEAYTLAARDYMHKPSFFNKIESIIKQQGGDAAFFMYKQLLPFASASWNWFKEGLMYTPIGIIKGITDFVKLENTIERMDNARMKGEKIESSRFAEYLAKRNLGKGVIGSIGLGIGVLLGVFGVAQIDEEDDKIKLRVGDTYLDVTNIFGTQGMFLGISLSNPRKGDWQALTVDVLETMFSDSTLTDLFNTFRYSDTIGDWLINQPSRMLGTMIPNLVKGISKLSYSHKVQYSPGVLGQFERIATSIPGVAHAFPTKIDPYTGETQMKYSMPFLYDAINMLTPVKVANYYVSDAEKTALELGVRKGNLTGRYSDIGNLNPDDISKLNTKYGELNKRTLEDLYSNKTKHRVLTDKGVYKVLTYRAMTPKQRKNVTERLMSDNARYSKIYVYTSNGGKYYASDTDYVALRKLGIKNVYKENPKKKGFN